MRNRLEATYQLIREYLCDNNAIMGDIERLDDEMALCRARWKIIKDWIRYLRQITQKMKEQELRLVTLLDWYRKDEPIVIKGGEIRKV